MSPRALTFRRKTEDPVSETPAEPTEITIKPMPNGPYIVRGVVGDRRSGLPELREPARAEPEAEEEHGE